MNLRQMLRWWFGLNMVGGLWAQPAMELPAGPWGLIEVAPLPLEPPDAAVDRMVLLDGRVWAAPAASTTAWTAFWAGSNLSTAAQQTLVERGRPDPEFPGYWCVEVPAELRLDLTPEARRELYDRLGEYWRNAAQVVPLPLPTEDDPGWAEADLNADLRAQLRRLAFVRRGQRLLADADLVLPLVRDAAELRRLKRLLSRVPALQLELRRESLAQRDAVTRYWTLPGARPASEVLAWFDHSPELEAVGVWNLLPANAREVFNTFMPPQPDGRMLNCYWTSLNLTTIPADDRLLASGTLDDACADYAAAVLRRDYEPVRDAPRFGDVIALSQESDEHSWLLHVMVVVAADVVLTKNGATPTQPLVFMREADAASTYMTPEPLTRTVWRKKAPPDPGPTR